MIENNENFQFQSVYHGSGASFDHFDTEHYGLSGEGSMSFGWGTYLTESEAIARDYADRQNGSGKKLDSLLKKYSDLYPHITPIYNHMSLGDSFEEAKKKYVGYLRENHIPGIRKITKSIEELKSEDFAELFKKDRNLYTVSIPDGKYLEWEKELTENESKHLVENYSNYFEYLTEDEKQEEAKQYVGKTGQEIYSHFENLLGSEKETSTFLHGIGYTGIKYPAGTIHSNGNGAYNYVIFDDADIEIKEHIQFQIQTEKNKSISSDFEPNIGDSEKLSDSILEGEPIKSISTDDFNYDGSNLKEFALEYIRNNPQGTANTKIGEVEISETGLRHSLSHTLYKNKLYSIPAIKDTLENGTYLGVIKDLDGKRQNNYYFAAPISIDDEKNVLFIRVKQVAGRDKAFYIHDVFTLDEIEKVTPYSGELNATQRSLRGATLAKSIIQDYKKNNIIQNNPLQFQQQNERNIALESQSAQKSTQEKSMENENNTFVLVDENQAARIRLAHELKENMPMLTEKERAAAIAICEAGAASMGMGLSDYINQTFPNGVFGDIEKARNAAHQQGVEINGAVSTSVFGDSVRATIYASRTADFSTWCHELSHVWQAQLSGKLKNDAEKAFQVQNGDWQNSVYTFSDGSQDTSAEAFAYGFEDFLKHKAGEMATEDKKTIFEKFADYMSRTYNGVKENIKVNEDIAKVYEQFVQLDDNILAEAEKAVRMEKEQTETYNNAIQIIQNQSVSLENTEHKNKKEVEEIFSNLKSITNANDLRNANFAVNTVGKILDHKGYDISTIAENLGELYRTSRRIITESEIKKPGHKEHPNFVAYHHYLNKFKDSKGDEYFIRFTLNEEKARNGKGRNIVHSTFISDVSIYKKTPENNVSGIIDPGEINQANNGVKANVSGIIDPGKGIKTPTDKKLMDFLDSVNVQFQAAYHGSGASFDHFNTTQYGLSGEGSMAFGWGTYLTSSEDIARDYADRQGSQKYTDINDSYDVLKTNVFGTLRNAAEMKGFEKAVQERKAALQHQIEDTDGFYSDEQKGNAKRLLEEMENLTENDLKTRHIYSVEIPDGKYLSWNNDVPEATKTEIAGKLHSHLVESDPESYSGNAANYLRQELESLFESEMDGQRFYGSLADYLGSERQASSFLHSIGYTGISYPAGTIYGNGNGATNYVIFNDDDIEIKEHLQFQLVGERSIMRMAESEEKERILADLSAAKLMEEKYKNMDAAARASRIRFATGWEKSADGRWKYELDDSKNRIKSGTLFQKILSTQPQMLEQLTKTTTLTLEDIMEAPELFNVFPFMKNVRVSFYSDPNAFRAVLTPEGIKINTQYLNEVDGEKGMKGVLAHEIQHVIQAVEYSSSNGLHGDSIELLYSDMQNAIKAAGTNRYDYDLTSLQEGLDEYMHDFGEVEARNVARRISMSYNERRHNTLESTEDVSRNLQFQTRGPASEKRNVELGEKYRNDFKFLNNVMSNGSGTVENKNVGEITFESGETGTSGYGIRHIIERRCQKDGKNVDEITALMVLVKEVSENGRITRENGRNIELQTENGIVSIVRKESDDKPYKWVLTGFEDFGNKEAATDAIQTVIAQYGYLPEYSSFRTQVGAVIASLNPNISQNEEKSINTQGEKTMPGEKQIIAEIGFADGEIRQYEDSVPFLKDLNEATRENAYDTTFRVYAESDELKRKAADVKLDNYDPIEASERMHNGYEWNDVEHEAVQFTQSAEGRRLLKDAENGRLTMLDARDILDAVEKNGMTLRYDPLPNSYVVDGWTAADGEKLDNYVVSMSELKRFAGIEISENSQQNQIQERKTARTPEEEQAYQEWLEMLDDNQQAEDIIARMQGVPPEEQKQLPEWQQRLNATIKQAAEMDGVKGSIKTALYDNAEKFTDVPFSREGYERLFQDGVVQSPLETIHFADNQFDVKDKEKFMLAAYQTLSNPDLIYAEIENQDNLESRNYVKTFIFGEDEKSALDIVVKTIDGQKVMISAQKRSLDDLIEHIKQPDQLIFMSEEIKQTIDRRSPEEKQRLKDVLPKLRIVPENTAYDKEKAIATARNFAVKKRNVALEAEQKPERDSSSPEREAYDRKHPTDWQIYTKELTDKLNAVSKEIENYLKYGTLPENSRFILPNSPQFLQKIGSHDTQISLPVAVVKKAHETHGLTLTEIQDAVKKLYNPVVVFDSDKSKSENKVDSKLILTDSFTSVDKPVALAMNINSFVQFQKDGHRTNLEVQDIRSIHDRTLIAKNGTDLIKKWTQDGLCRYVDDKKISDWSTVAGIYFPIEALQSPKNNILTKTEIVNSFGKENTPKENIPQEIKKEVTADRLNTDSKEKSLANKKYSPKEYLKYRSELFLKHLDHGNLPFMKGEQIGDDIIIKVKAVRNASNGRALTGFQQLMAQDIINTMVENKEIPRMDYEIITYEQAKEAGTFIKKGSPHFTLPVYNEKTNTVFNQIYYFKSGCHEPGKADLLKLKIQRESFIVRERAKLEKAMKERDVPADEKNKIYTSIAENHKSIIQYLNSTGKRQEAMEYKNNIPSEERDVFDKLEEKKEIELNELLRKNAEYQHRIEEEEFKRQKENPAFFNARESSSYEDFLGKTMAAMSIGGIVVTSKSTIDSVRSTLTPVLKQAFDQYDYIKGFQIGEIANGKCKENLRETRNNNRENQEIKQTLDKALAFQQGGRNIPPDRSKEIDGYDR